MGKGMGESTRNPSVYNGQKFPEKAQRQAAPTVDVSTENAGNTQPNPVAANQNLIPAPAPPATESTGNNN